ncbi:MAG: histidine--tRNA ligase [Mariprofundaceae bacterium]
MVRSIRGVHDAFPDETSAWQRVEQVARDTFGRYGFSEIRLPIMEPTELFVRSIGKATDIVNKEMYSFLDKGGDALSLRPEGTAGVVRAYLQASLTRSGTQRWYYMGPMFRRERPQKGRLRQFQQIGVELIGPAGPVEDAEILAMARDMLKQLSIEHVRYEVNSLGCNICRPGYRKALLDFLQAHKDKLCETCQERTVSNPIRVLDCKVPSCGQILAGAPVMTGYLCEACEQHFSGFKSGLEALEVPYVINPYMVRGLDYYTRSAFEITTDRLGSQGTVIAGGRYDGLIEELGGPAIPAVGFALGLERLSMLIDGITPGSAQLAVVAIGDEALTYSLKIARKFRESGIKVVHCGSGSAKTLFKRAHREGVYFVAVVGDEEMRSKMVSIKSMLNGKQQQLTIKGAIDHITS